MVVMARLAWPRPRRHSGTSTSRKRHDHSRRPSSNTAIEGFDPGAERTLWGQSEDRGQVADAHEPGGSPDGAPRGPFNGAVGRRGNADHRVPSAHAPAAG